MQTNSKYINKSEWKTIKKNSISSVKNIHKICPLYEQDKCACVSESALMLLFMCDPFQLVTVQMIFTKLKYICVHES